MAILQLTPRDEITSELGPVTRVILIRKKTNN